MNQLLLIAALVLAAPGVADQAKSTVEEDESEPATALASTLGTDTLGLGLTGRFE